MNVMLDNGAYMPEKAHDTDAGYDLRTPVNVVVMPHDSAIVNLGVHMEIPKGYVGMLKSKSGLNVKHDLTCEGVIDCGYTGSIVAKIYNHGNEPYSFHRGDKFTQIVIMPIGMCDLVQVDKFADSDRGDGGFGSTGK